MSATTVVRLDTTAPRVNLGAVEQSLGGSLTAYYTIDETPYTITAQLIAGSWMLDMAVLPDRFMVSIPPEMTESVGVISVTSVDEVLNENFQSFPILLLGKTAALQVALEESPDLATELFDDPELSAVADQSPEITHEGVKADGQ